MAGEGTTAILMTQHRLAPRLPGHAAQPGWGGGSDPGRAGPPARPPHRRGWTRDAPDPPPPAGLEVLASPHTGSSGRGRSLSRDCRRAGPPLIGRAPCPRPPRPLNYSPQRTAGGWGAPRGTPGAVVREGPACSPESGRRGHRGTTNPVRLRAGGAPAGGGVGAGRGGSSPGGRAGRRWGALTGVSKEKAHSSLWTRSPALGTRMDGNTDSSASLSSAMTAAHRGTAHSPAPPNRS